MSSKISKSRGRGRPITNRTKLGRMINNRGYRIYELAGIIGVSPRSLTEYVAARRIIPLHQLDALCSALSCTREELVEEWLTENLTTSTGVVIGGGTVKDLNLPLPPEPTVPLETLPPLDTKIAPTFIKR